VTSATTSDYTAELNLAQVNTGVLVVTDSVTIETLDYNFGTGSAQAFKDALEIASADITDATSENTASTIVKRSSTGYTEASTFAAIYPNDSQSGYLTIGNKDGATTYETIIKTDANTAGTLRIPNLSWDEKTAVITDNTDGSADALTDGTIAGTTTFNSTSYTYGTGAATAHRDALDIASADLQIESLFTLLTFQESDAGVFTANLGTATSSQDGDSLSLSSLIANQRPNVYRFRNWNKNPGVSGTANAVIPVRLACAGNIYHLGSGANGASLRCGFGMVNGASAVAADANATTGRGFGWRIAWNSSTSKLEFNLWAHNGTTYVEGTGIDTGLGAGNLDGFFNIILRLASDGTVTAHTWFGSSTSTSAVPSSTPTATLAGGPTSGNFANLGTPAWVAATHSTNAPSSGNSIIARISNRKLHIG
jgi:hypothetical protein